MYRVNLPPKADGTPRLILPDTHVTQEEAIAFFHQNYADENLDWFWLETIRQAKIVDLIPPSVIPGLIKEGLAEHGIDDSFFTDKQYQALNTLACASMDAALEDGSLTIPAYIVESARRVDVTY